MKVVEHEDERLLLRDQTKEAADRAMGAVALIGDGPTGAVRACQRWQHLSELRGQLVVPGLLAGEVLRDDVCVQSVDPNAEGHLALELGGGAGEHHVSPLLGSSPQLPKQSRLADARLSLDRNVGRPALGERVERRLEMLELSFAPNQCGGGAGLRVHRWASIRQATPLAKMLAEGGQDAAEGTA